MTQDPIRHYVLLDTANEDVRTGYFNPNARAADIWARAYIGEHVYGPAVAEPPFDVVARPSKDLTADSTADLARPKIPSEVVVAVSTARGDRRTSEDVIDDIVRAVHEKPHIFAGSSPDIPFAALDHWCMADASDPVFSDRSGAERLLGVDYLREQNQTTGRGVNVVIVDQGLDRQDLGDSYGGGWRVGTRQPGSPPPRGGSVRRPHGMMIAHNILKVAPEATLFDLPLAPTKISDIQAFLSDADAAFRKMLEEIAVWKSGKYPGPWILVNPWGIYDRRSEYPAGHYTTNPDSPFNKLVAQAVSDNIDVVFAAGNCGQFCPDNRCGANDRGPGSSIWGANSLGSVLTVGAVRADGMWLGYSSQGPGQPNLGAEKPDFCAASQFREDDDVFSINSGTSAACGLTGGIVAALRSRWDATAVSPDQLKSILNETARKPPQQQWDSRLGNGILDARAAFDALAQQYA